MILKKILLFAFLALVIFVSFGIAAPSGSATPCPPASLFQEKPFLLYFEKQKDFSEVTAAIMRDFPDAVVQISGSAAGGVMRIVAKIYVPASENAKFSSYLSASVTGMAKDLSLGRMKIIKDKNDTDYKNVMGGN
jgi:hypothetical protein